MLCIIILICSCFLFFFFFSSRRRHTRLTCDWSSDVCSSDLCRSAVGGLTLGADPVATALLHAAASRGLDLDAFVVRKEAKAHGLQRRIEEIGRASCRERV